MFCPINAKPKIAQSMYDKGKNFIGAAILLRRLGRQTEYVVLHLICQGMEVIPKRITSFQELQSLPI